MNVFVGEYKRYKSLLENAIEQVSEDDMFKQVDEQGNSIAVLVKHLAGNLRSRFTDFLTTDGEKEWRDRESEFDVGQMTKVDLMQTWSDSWNILTDSVFPLSPDDMSKTVTIRGVPFTVEEALARSLSHFSYHVGQIVYLARSLRGKDWKYLSIPPGGSSTYNQNPTLEKGFSS